MQKNSNFYERVTYLMHFCTKVHASLSCSSWSHLCVQALCVVFLSAVLFFFCGQAWASTSDVPVCRMSFSDRKYCSSL